jgi:zinc-ribbon domain
LRCPRCGNENPGSNRFCGMCGATLLQAPAPAVAGQGTAASHGVGHSEAVPAPAAPARQETATRPAAPPRRESPAITGPSFLGLNQSTSTSSRAPSPSARRNILSIDPHSAPSSRDLDYLLDDDDPKRGGAWKYLLMLLALGLAVGFGYLRFKDQGLAWLNSVTKKPSAGQTSETPDSGNQAPATAAPTGTATNAPTSTPGPSAPPASGTAQPGNAAAASPPAAGAPAATPPIRRLLLPLIPRRQGVRLRLQHRRLRRISLRRMLERRQHRGEMRVQRLLDRIRVARRLRRPLRQRRRKMRTPRSRLRLPRLRKRSLRLPRSA